MTHTHRPIYHLTGKNACGNRIPDLNESITKDGISGQHMDKVCRCRDHQLTNHFTSRPQPADLRYYDRR